MRRIPQSKVLAFLAAITIATLFLYFTVKEHSIFNIIPFAIHEAIDPGGNSETTFITIFDVIIALLLSLISYKIVYKMLKKT